MDETYLKKTYSRQVVEDSDALTVNKHAGSDWAFLKMEINGRMSGEICLRSREMAEHLHFMLGQLLR